MDVLESTYCDYMMLISPPAEVKETVRKLKLSSAKVIGEYEGMHSIAHITVTGQGRQMPVMMKEKLPCRMVNGHVETAGKFCLIVITSQS